MTPRRPRPRIGWREWVSLPEICPSPIKAKVDTGARTSALHAFGLETFDTEVGVVAAFELHPRQRSGAGAEIVEYPVTSFKQVRSSNGKVEERPVIVADALLGDVRWPIEITLTSRDHMGFRMLLGRAAVRRRFLIDPGRSFLMSDRNYRSDR